MLIVSGGYTESAYTDSTEIFDPSVGSWRDGAALPSPMGYMKATTMDNRVFIFGINN